MGKTAKKSPGKGQKTQGKKKGPAPGKPAEPIVFGTATDLAVRPIPISQMSQTTVDGVLTVLFDSLSVDLQAPSAPLQDIACASIAAPCTIPASRAIRGFKNDLRGAILIKSKGARIVIAINAGGASALLTYDFGKSITGRNIFKSISAPYQKKGNPQAGAPPDQSTYIITITILAQRRSTSEQASIQLDGLDIAASTK